MFRLNSYDAHDNDLILRDTHFNTLESLIYKVREYLTPDPSPFLASLDPIHHDALHALVDGIQNWLYDGGEGATSNILEEKLKQLRALVDPAKRRMEEGLVRDGKVTRLRDALNQAAEIGKVMDETFKLEAEVKRAKEEKQKQKEEAAAKAAAAGEEPKPDEEEAPPAAQSIYTPSDLTALTALIDTTNTWLDDLAAKQQPLLPHQDPVLTVAALDKKIVEVNTAVMGILQRGMKRQEEQDRLKKEREKAERSRKREKEKEEKKRRKEEEKKKKEEKEAKEGKKEGGAPRDEL